MLVRNRPALVPCLLLLAAFGCNASSGGSGSPGDHDGPITPEPPDFTGWTDAKKYLVTSDGTHGLGDGEATFNSTRDRGTKIVFFDAVSGDNDTAEVYWWDGANVVDSQGHVANAAGQTYGTDPLQPNLAAIKPFRQAIGMIGNAPGDHRLRTHLYTVTAAAGGYPDWYLFRRGQVHDTFDGTLFGGASETEPMVVAGYGPLADGRVVMAPLEDRTVTYAGNSRKTINPFSGNASKPLMWLHVAYFSLEFRSVWFGIFGFEGVASYAGGPITALLEDCAWIRDGERSPSGGALLYLPTKTSVRRSIIANIWTDTTAHSMGYYTAGWEAQVTFDEVTFYRGGYHTDPTTDPDPKRDIYSRNIYEGGGGWMGHTHRNMISADGASGGPQMRLGGRIEDSLIVEGYWYSGTNSNEPVNDWLTTAAQASGNPSAVVRNNVQLVFAYPTPQDPDTLSASDGRSQPGWGYELATASFGSLVEGNIISGAMLEDDLGATGRSGHGIRLGPSRETYADGVSYTQVNNTIRNNIVYRTGTGLVVDNDWTGVAGDVVEGNVFAVGSLTGGRAGTAIQRGNALANLASAGQLVVRNNHFYAGTGGTLQPAAWMGTGNTLAAASAARTTEGWPDPDRTLKRYVTEVLGLTLLEWDDDPYLTRHDAGPYDPTGLKTFMAVNTRMRLGGKDGVPTSGKPSWTGDYAWDERYTAKAVVTWIRAGFGLPAAE